MAFAMAMDWHEGEKRMHRLMKVPRGFDNSTAPGLTMQASTMLKKAPLLAIGTLDDQNRPWTTLWGGTFGFAQPIGGALIGIRTPVDAKNDPVVQAIFFDEKAAAEDKGAKPPPRMIGGLTLDLETGKRVKLYGRMAAGAVAEAPDQDTEEKEKEAQLVVRIDQSLGNCPKYFNAKRLEPASTTKSEVISEATALSQEAKSIILTSDVFFLSSSNADKDMDTNHRGGPPGFVRVSDTPDGTTQVIWPEYSGNRMYQSLGNLQLTPRAGLVFADFSTGDVLYLTGDTEILAGSEASSLMPRSNLAVRVTITAAKHVRAGLPFRGTPGKRSPYNPRVRPLASEVTQFAQATSEGEAHSRIATLVERTQLTSDVYRMRFTLDKPASWSSGQWVALDLSAELDEGYSHMRNDDPTSLNDDWIRTFTISSAAPSSAGTSQTADTFEITLRAVGPVTRFLVRQNPRAGLEIPVRGIGGDFEILANKGVIPFVAGGVGITPLLAALPQLNEEEVVLLWSIREGDLPLVKDTLKQFAALAKNTRVFVTGGKSNDSADGHEEIASIRKAGATIERRRLTEKDLLSVDARKWYMCAGGPLTQAVSSWLETEGRKVVFEEFNY